MKTKYRIVKDGYSGFEAQVWHWWWPGWQQLFRTNTSRTIEDAMKVIEQHKKQVVWEGE